MRIQYCSDLHLELWKKTTFDETIEVKAEYLVLCGDVSRVDSPNLRSFLEYISERWKMIFWIPGNEEIWKYSNNEEVSLQKMRDIANTYKNIKVLYKSSYLLKDNNETVRIVGLSLWHQPRNNIMLRYHNNIYVKAISTICSSQLFLEAHINQVKYLEYVIKNSDYPLIICSYYAPFTWLYEEDYIQEPKDAILDSNLEKLVTYPIIAWIAGHNHLPIEYTRRYFLTTGYDGSVLFVSNPRGKPKQNPYYRKEAVINVKPLLLEGFEEKVKEELPVWAKRY